MTIRSFIVLSALVLLAAVAAIDESNLSSGWYSGMPPVSKAQLDPVVGCLVKGGMPPNPQLIQHDAISPTLPPPTLLLWSANGRRSESDAMWTYYTPWATYVEVMKDISGISVGQGALNELTACVAKVKEKDPVVVVRPNPLGEKIDPETCNNRLGTPACWNGNVQDKFLPGDEFSTSEGTLYRKYNGGFFFFTWSCWARKAEAVKR